jgi:phenylacetate-CoA ligase
VSSAKERWLACVRRWQLQPESPGGEDWWAPELERASRDRLEEIQSEKIAAAAAYLYEDSPFYRGKFDEVGLRPADVRSVEDLWKVPITRKQEWADDTLQHPPWGTFSPLTTEDWGRRGFMLFTSSGVTGAPRAFRHTTHDRDLWAWLWARTLWAQGVRPGDVLINCIGYGPYTAYWGAHYAMNLIGCPVIPGSGVSAEGRATYIDAYAPTVLTCTPSHGLYLAETMRRMGLDPAASSIRLVVAGGEQGACIPATKRRLERAWGATAVDVFGGAEVAMAPLGYQCSNDAGSDPPYSPHLMEDCYAVEIVDPSTGEPMAEGSTGITVVSNLFSEAQPILRFEMADLMLVTSAPCPCGRTQRRAVGGVLGREDDVVKVRGRAVQPSGFEAAVRSVWEAADEFEVVIDRRDGGQDEVVIRVEAADGADLDARVLAGHVVDAVRRELGLTVGCEVVAAGTLRRPEAKARRVHDRRRVTASGADLR